MLVPAVSILLVSLLIGLYAATRIKGNIRNFFVGGNVLPGWVLVFSLMGQAIELGGTQDNAERTLHGSFWDGAVLPIGVGISLIVTGLFFAKRLHAYRLLTLPDYYSRRFGTHAGALVSILCVTSFVLLIAGNLAALGVLLQLSLGLPASTCIVIVSVIVTFYTMAGGFFASTWNDILQISIACVSFIVAFVWLLDATPWASITAAVDRQVTWQPLTSLDHGSMKVWASLLALALGDVVALDFMERTFAARTASAARSSCIIAGCATIVAGGLLACIGVLAGLQPGATESSFLELIVNELPPSVGMLLVMGLIGTGISTIDGAVMACAKTLSRNVLATVAPRAVTGDKLIRTTRLVAVPVATVATVIAILFPVPGDLLILAFDVVFAGCFVPLAIGLYSNVGGALTALVAIIVPSALRIAFHFIPASLLFGDARLDGLQTLVPPLVSLGLFLTVAKLSKEAAGEAP